MAAHRFRALIEQVEVSPTREIAAGAFMPCPLMGVIPAAHLTFVQEVYRLAQERTQAQLRPARSRLPQFSLN